MWPKWPVISDITSSGRAERKKKLNHVRMNKTGVVKIQSYFFLLSYLVLMFSATKTLTPFKFEWYFNKIKEKSSNELE